MTKLTISDPNGNVDLNHMFDIGGFEFGDISHFSESHMIIEYSGGLSFSYYGYFPLTSTADWNLSSVTVSKIGSFKIEIEDLEISYLSFENAISIQDVAFDGNDTVISDSPNGHEWKMKGGDDKLKLGGGDDKIWGGEGVDVLLVNDNLKNAEFFSNIEGIHVITQDGSDWIYDVEILEFNDKKVGVIYGGFSDSVCYGNKNGVRDDVMMGGDGNDKLYAKSGRDIVNGEQGNDKLYGGAGGDFLSGGAGSDFLNGGAGVDKIQGGKGDDVLIGGDKSDRFVFKKGDGHDILKDFEAGIDIVRIGRGASDFDQLRFHQTDSGVDVSFSNVTITFEDALLSQIQNPENFIL